MDVTMSYELTSEEKAKPLCKQLWRILYNGELVCQIVNNNCAKKANTLKQQMALKPSRIQPNVVRCRIIVLNTLGLIEANLKENQC